jgi:hypothetical protein
MSLVITLCFTTSAFGESWLERLFGSSEEPRFTAEERQQIKEYFIEKALQMKERKGQGRAWQEQELATRPG